MGLEPNRTIFAVPTRTAGRLPGAVANTIHHNYSFVSHSDISFHIFNMDSFNSDMLALITLTYWVSQLGYAHSDNCDEHTLWLWWLGQACSHISCWGQRFLVLHLRKYGWRLISSIHKRGYGSLYRQMCTVYSRHIRRDSNNLIHLQNYH